MLVLDLLVPSSDTEGRDLLPTRCWLPLPEVPGKGTLIRLRPGSLSRRRGLHCVSGCACRSQLLQAADTRQDAGAFPRHSKPLS